MTPKTIRKSGIVIPNRLKWHQRVALTVATGLTRVMMATWRVRWENPDPHPVTPGPIIFCMWHNRLALSVLCWDKFAQAKWPSTGMTALISASKDGALMSGFVEKFGVLVVRGSSSRRGPQALLEATSYLEKKYSITVTPDGPRGPAYHAKPGVIHLAHITGAPIVPISAFIHKKVCAKSWDKFQIPLPFSRCDVRYGAPIHVSRDASPEELENKRQELEKALMAITTD